MATKQLASYAADIDRTVTGFAAHAADAAVHTTAAEKQKLAGLENYDDSEIRAALAQTVDAAAKNRLPNNAVTTTVNGVTFTVHADGTITANGTASGTSAAILRWTAEIPAGTWVFSSNSESSHDAPGWDCYIWDTAAGAAIARDYDFEPGQTFTLAQAGTYRIDIRVKAGTTADNVVFRPMVCAADVYAISDEYAPYAPSNRELYELFAALEARVAALEGGA